MYHYPWRASHCPTRGIGGGGVHPSFKAQTFDPHPNPPPPPPPSLKNGIQFQGNRGLKMEKNHRVIVLCGKIMISQGVRHPLSCLGVLLRCTAVLVLTHPWGSRGGGRPHFRGRMGSVGHDQQTMNDQEPLRECCGGALHSLNGGPLCSPQSDRVGPRDDSGHTVP